jgi:hypothetical protein
MAQKKNKGKGHSTSQTLKSAAGRAGKKKHTGISKDAMTDLRYGFGGTYNPGSTWKKMNPRQRQVAKRVARRTGKSLSGFLGGGPRALQERNAAGIKKQATNQAKAAYAPEVNELNDRELKSKALYDKQVADEEKFGMWAAGEQAKLQTRAQAADEALRGTYQQIATAQNQTFDAASQQAGQQGGASGSAGPDVAGAATYGQGEVELARTAAAGATGAAAREAASRTASRAELRGVLQSSQIDRTREAREGHFDQLRADLTKIGEQRKDLSLRRSADISKEMSRLRDQEIDKAQANRESKMLGQELGIKAYDAKTERLNDIAQNRLNWKKYKADLTDKQLGRALDQAKLKLAERDLSRKERADASLAAHRIQQEIQARKNAKGGGGPGGKDWSEGALNAWGDIVDLSGSKGNLGQRPDGVSKLQWEASRAIKGGGRLTYDLYHRLIEANIAVPPKYKPKSSGTGPH